ncbi:GNAT family N-acetyltransferase [Quadrisphaera sp. DSM 44207]|uniref:GNAT family N-acetyltransferase n=1 Tax=Quadrisphaera sp. DSM 44207 TaxID=1881057 RepID=UPI000884F4FF|nr:GNAT family N-acetyltransferase [Quadrisphaera sp. DSM 44207]SDQ45028.1 Ribosomal protein S18 acetylase RimI [Quadrisphaera sp. DSM 44207]
MKRRTVEVRRVGADDIDLVILLAERARGADGAERGPVHAVVSAPRERVEAVLARPDVEVHVALADDGPVGVVVLRLGDLLGLTGGAAVHVDQLYVHPAWRHRGVARQLLAAAVCSAERVGAEEVACVVPPGGREVQRFFARLGFAPLVTLRVVAAGRLRARLAGDHEDGRRRVALDQLVARRRRQLAVPAGTPGADPVGAAATVGLPVAVGAAGAVAARPGLQPVPGARLSAAGRRAAGR